VRSLQNENALEPLADQFFTNSCAYASHPWLSI